MAIRTYQVCISSSGEETNSIPQQHFQILMKQSCLDTSRVSGTYYCLCQNKIGCSREGSVLFQIMTAFFLFFFNDFTKSHCVSLGLFHQLLNFACNNQFYYKSTNLKDAKDSIFHVNVIQVQKFYKSFWLQRSCSESSH